MNKKRLLNKRLTIALGIVGLLLIICIGRAVFLVVKYGNDYKHKVLSQATASSTAVVARPGNIVDANGMYLTSTRKVYRLILDPKALADTEKNHKGSQNATISILAKCFSLSESDLRRTFEENPKSQYIRYAKCPILEENEKLAYDNAVADFAKEQKDNNGKVRIAGVWFEEEYRKSYPFNDALCKIIGYTTEDTSEGILGLEKQYHSYLSGTDGREYTYVDERGNVQKEITAARDGYTLYTSLDINVSKILREEIKNFQENMEGGNRVNCLVMNVEDASIIAMESDTAFDLNNPTDLSQIFTEEELEAPEETFLLQEAYHSKPELLDKMTYEERLTALLQQVQNNYCVSSAFEPGSTAKTLTIASGIEDKSIQKDDTFYCNGVIPVDRYLIHCHNEKPCGNLTPMEALGMSCNVCLVQIAEKIGKTGFTKFQERFNLGQKTNIDLPGEANTKNLIYYENNMNEVELATCSFGQGFNVTMIQMAAAYASILNGGNYYEPRVVKRIDDADGNTVKELSPVLTRHTVSAETSEYMKEALRYVVCKGTASGTLYTDGYSLGGKTGAAEKLPRGTGKYVISFIGGAPIENPKFLLYVVVDEPHVEDQSMSVPACKLADRIFKRLYGYYNIFNENEADAYTYDWSNLTDFSGNSDSAKGEPNIEDPDQSIDWIEAESEEILQ